MDSTNLKKRGQTWYARVKVPRPQRHLLNGQTELLQSLKTTSLAEARRLRHRVVHELQQEISRRVLAAETLPGTAEYVIEIARSQRQSVIDGIQPEENAEAGLDVAVEEFLDDARRARGFDPETGDPHLSETELRALQLAHKVFRGEHVAMLAEQVKAHLAEEAPRITAGALEDKRRRLNAFAKWAGNVDCSVLTRKLCARYVQEIIQTSGLSVKAKRKWLSWLSGFGDYLETYGHVEQNPWAGLSKRMRESTRGGTKPPPRPWTPDEVTRLLGLLPAGSALLPLAIISAYSGQRIDEIASLKVEDVTADAFRITIGKTKNSVRVVPMHVALASMVERLKATSDDGYLVPGLLPGGRDQKRSHFPSKYFGRFIRANGFTDPLLNFHGLRRSFAQRAETAGVPQSTCNLLDGHARQNLSYGLYSDGPDWPVLVDAVAKVTYGATCDQLVRDRAADAVVIERMKRRVYRRPRAKRT